MRSAIVFFVITYLVTGLLWLPAIRSGQSLATVMQAPAGLAILVATITPTLVAITLSGFEHGWRGIGDLLRQGTRWRFGIGWYALAVFLIPLVWAVALVTGLLVGGGCVGGSPRFSHSACRDW